MTGKPGHGAVTRLITRSTIFVIARFVPMGASFLLLPLYTKYLTTSDYGIVALATTFSNILTILCLQSVEGAFGRFYYDIQEDARRREFFGANWLFLLFYSLAVCGVVEIAGSLIGTLGFQDIPYQPYLRLVVWTVFLNTVALSLPRALFLVREQAWQYAGVNLAVFGISTLLIVDFIVIRGEGALGNLRGTFFGTAIVAAVGLVVTLRNIRFVLHWSYIRAALMFVVPAIPHLLALWALNLSDRFILQQYVSLADVGVYSFGATIGSVVLLIALSVAEAINPFYYRTASTHAQASSILARLATYYVALIAWLGVGMVALVREVVSMIAARPEYNAAVQVVPLVVAGCVALSFYYVFVAAVYYSKRLRWLPVVTGISSATSICLNLLLIPRLGYIGAALTTFISFSLQAVAMYRVARGVFPLPYEWRRLTIVVVLAVGASAGLFFFNLANVWLSLALKGLLALLFPLLLWGMRFFSTEELAWFGAAMRQWRAGLPSLVAPRQ